jgi:hypothetical protein
MPISAGAKSIAEVIAEAERQKAETARRAAQEYAQRKQAAVQAAAKGGAPAGGRPSAGTVNGRARTAAAATPGTAAPPHNRTDDLRDEFDYALEAVETARKSLGRDTAAVEKMATNLLVAKAGVSREDAPRFIRKALQYLDG